MGARLPDWNHLVSALADKVFEARHRVSLAKADTWLKLPNETKVRLLESKAPMKAAFRSALRWELYKDHLASYVSPTIKAVGKYLAKCSSKGRPTAVITYNFDDLLERHLRKAHPSVKFRSIYSKRTFAERGACVPIYHPHGFIPVGGASRLSSDGFLVFSEPEYHAQYFDLTHWSNLIQLQSFLQSTCLFIGFSFEDKNVRRLMDQANKADRDGLGHLRAAELRHVAIRQRRKKDKNTSAKLASLTNSIIEADYKSFGIRPYWVDNYDKEIPALLAKLYSSLWRKALKDIGLSKAKPGLGFAAEEVTEYSNLVEGLPDEISPDDVRRVLGELGRGRLLVVIFDEFDRLADAKVTQLMADTIKALSDYATPATIVLIGVADSVDGLIGDHQSVERALVQINMPRMSDAEIEQIIVNGGARLGMTVEPVAAEEIKGLSQGLPYITHLLGLHVVHAAIDEQKKHVTMAHIEKGISKALEQWQQSTAKAYYFATKSQQPDTIYREVLLACALAERDDLGFFTAAAVRKPLRIITGRPYDIPNFARHLKQLSEKGRGDMLQRVGEARRLRYRFTSPLLCPYILMKGFTDKLLDKDKLVAVKAS